MRTFLSPYPPRSVFMYTCGLFVMLAMMFLRTDTVVAQTESSNTNLVSEGENHHWRVGIYFSGYGWSNKFWCDIDFNCIDNMPYPIVHGSVHYKNYQVISSWSKDENEFIFNLIGRYNYHPLKKYRFRPFVFAGFSMWYFNRMWPYRMHRSNSPEYVPCGPPCYEEDFSIHDNLIRYDKFTDLEFTYEVSRDRPDNKSMTLGFTGGFGIEYTISRLVFSHEIGWYQDLAGCPYTEFICTVRDFKFLSISFEI